MKTLRDRLLLSTLTAAALCAFGGRAHAQQDGTWSSAASGSWANAANWSGGLIATGATFTADFSTLTLSAATTVTLDGARTLGNLHFGDVGNTYGWILNTGTGGPLTLAGTPTITTDGLTTNTIGAVLAGSAGMTKAGSGTLALTALDNFTGGTVVNAGTLLLSYNSGGNGTLAGTLTINPGATAATTVGNALGYGGNWVRTVNVYGGTFTNTASGADACWEVTFNLMGGTLASGPGRFAVDNNAASAFNSLATNVVSTISGTINTRSTSGLIPFNVAAGTATPDLLVSALINNNAAGQGIVKLGAGVMSLTAANTFTGGTIVSNGVLQLSGGGGATGTLVNSPVTVYGVGQLWLNTGDALGYNYLAARTLTLSSGGTMREVSANSETLGRPITMTNGIITANAGAGNPGATVLGDCYNLFNATAVVTTSPNTTNYISLPAGCNFALRGGSFSNAAGSFLIVNGKLVGWNGSSSYGLAKAGAGTMILNSNNTYTGVTTVTGGNLQVNGSIAGGAVTVANATLSGTGTIGGATTILTGGALQIGPAISTLTINNSLALNSGSTTFLKISKTGGILANDAIVGMTAMTYGGTLTISNATSDATPLALGDSFTLFPAGSYASGFSTINLPAAPSDAKWDTSGLTVNGTIALITTNQLTTPSFAPPAGGYIGAQSVAVSSDAGSTIYYTTDGSTPTLASPHGTSPVTVNVPVNTTLTIKAFAHGASISDSPVGSAIYNTLDHGTWTNLAGGSWPVAGNWSNGVVASGSAVTADFSTLTLTANTIVTLDAARTIGRLVFGDVGNLYTWTLNTTGPLTLDAGNTTPTIVVNNQTTTINSTLAGTNGITQTGNGTLVLSSAANSFTGNLTVSQGTLTTGTGTGSGNTTSTLGAKVPGRSIVVATPATMNLTVNNIFGGNGMYASNLPTVVVSGTLNSSRYNAMPSIVLNGGTLTQSATDGPGTYEGYMFLGPVTVTGSTPSTISSGNNKADHLLSTGTLFDVANVTGDASPDLVISAILKNSSGDYTPTTAGGLVKSGAGTLELAGANTYTGSTIVSNGTLQVSDYGSIAAGGTVTVLTNGILDGTGYVNSPVTIQAGGTLAPGTTNMGTLYVGSALTLAGKASFRITKTGGGTAADSVSSLTSVTYGGTLTVVNVTTDATPLADGDTFYLFSSSSYAGVFATFNLPALPAGLSWDKSGLTVNGSLRVANTAATPYFSPVAGAYLGAQTVTIIADAGSTIYYTTDGSYPDTSSPHGLAPIGGIVIPVDSTMTIQAFAKRPGYSDSPVATANYITMSKAIWTDTGGGSWPESYRWQNGVVGTGSGVTADFGTLSLYQDTMVTLDGARTIGNLIFGDLGNTYSWILTNGTAGPLTLDGTNTPTITVNSTTAIFQSVVTGTNGLIKAGLGTLQLNGFNTISNGVTVNAGTLFANAPNGGTGAVGDGDVTVNSSGTILVGGDNSFVGTNPSASTNVVTINAGGMITNAGSTTCHLLALVMNGGTLAAATSNPTWGNWNLDHGVFTPGSGRSSLIDGGNAALIQAGGSVFNIGANDTLTVSTVVAHCTSAADNGLIKTGPGKLVLAAANTYPSATSVSNGTLQVDGAIATGAVTVTNATLSGAGTVGGAVTIQSGGTLAGTLTISGTAIVQSGGALAPGASLGTLTFSNALVLSAGSTTTMELNKAGAVLTSDRAVVMTTVTYGGTLTVTTSGDALADGDTFTLFTAGTYSGSFASLNLPALGAGLTWDKSSLSVNGTLRVSHAAATPIFNPPAGGYPGTLLVTISSDPGSTIFYTTDGTPPTASSPHSISPVTGLTVPVNSTMTIMAYATNAGFADSPVATASYITLATPTWTNVAGGSWSAASNWLDTVIANGSGVTADFSTLTLPTNTTVTLDSLPTVGQILFADVGNAYAWTVNNGSGGSLALDAGAAVPVIAALTDTTNAVNATLTGTNGLAKTGPGAVALGSIASSYGGNVAVKAGTLIAAGAANPSASLNSVLGLKSPARTITVVTNATMAWSINNVFGGQNLNATNLPGILIDGGTFILNRYNAIGNVTLRNGASLLDNIPTGTDSALYDGAQFIGTVSVIGTQPSTIGTLVSGRGDHLLGGAAITFDVANVTGNADADLTVSCDLRDGSNDYNTNGTASALTKTGAGTLVLSAANDYSGVTTVSNGTLQVDGSLNTNTVTVVGGVLAGSGTINGPVLVEAAGTLAPGTTSIGTLTINNTLSLAGAASFRLHKAGAALSGDLVQGLASVTYGGALTVTTSGDPLAAGDSFKLFDSGAYAGAFASTNLPALPAGLAWQWSPETGTLSVTGGAVAPTLSGIAPSANGSVTLTFSGASGQGYTVLASTNVALSVGLWTPLTTGTFGAGPATYTDTHATNYTDRFYLIKSP